jgi:hypothetical protein
MRVRRFTSSNWIEFTFGALLPTIVFGPFLVIGLGALPFMAKGMGGFIVVLPSLIVAGVCLAALASLWIVLLFGPNQVKEHRHLRRVVATFILLGVLFGGFGTVFGAVMVWQANEAWLWIPWLVLVGPFIVGLRYLPSLNRRSQN